MQLRKTRNTPLTFGILGMERGITIRLQRILILNQEPMQYASRLQILQWELFYALPHGVIVFISLFHRRFVMHTLYFITDRTLWNIILYQEEILPEQRMPGTLVTGALPVSHLLSILTRKAEFIPYA